MKQVEERYISLLTDKVFDRLFEEAEIARFTPQEQREYEASKKAYRDIKNSGDTAKREGIAEGMEKGMKQGMEKGMKQGMEKERNEAAKPGNRPKSSVPGTSCRSNHPSHRLDGGRD